MSNTRYKISIDGTLAPGVTIDFAQEQLARLFKTDTDAVKALFSGKPITVKRDISSSEADKYLQALFSAGVVAQKEAEPTAHLSLEAIVSESNADNPTQMTCPKCSARQAEQQICQSCGIVIAKFTRHQAQAAGMKNTLNSSLPSPYATPKASMGQNLEEVGELNIWGIEGRLGRMRYIAWSMVYMFAMLPVLLISILVLNASLWLGGLLIFTAAIAAIVLAIQISVKRLHDIGWSGWLLLLSLIPVVGSIFQLLIFVIPGSQAHNRYGAPPPANSTAVKVLFWIWVALLCSGFVLGLITDILGTLLSAQ